MTVTLDAASKSANAVLSGGNLTLDTNLNFVGGAARSTTKVTAGLYGFEASHSGAVFIGLTNQANPNPASEVGNFRIDTSSGFITIGGVFVAFIAFLDPLQFVYDATAHRVYVKSLFGWNSEPTGDPCAGLHGFDVSSIDATGLYAYGNTPIIGRNMTFNFGAVSLLYPLPSCVTAWDAPPIPVPHMRHYARMAPFGNRMTARSYWPGNYTAHSLQAAWATTEAPDVFAATMAPGIGATMAATEDPDVFLSQVRLTNDIELLVDGEFIYRPEEPDLLRPGEPRSSRFVIPSVTTMVKVPGAGG